MTESRPGKAKITEEQVMDILKAANPVREQNAQSPEFQGALVRIWKKVHDRISQEKKK